MRLADITLANIAASPEWSTLHGTRRLLRDLVAVGLMQQDLPSASERLEFKLGPDLSGALFESLTGSPGGGAPRHLRPSQAA